MWIQLFIGLGSGYGLSLDLDLDLAFLGFGSELGFSSDLDQGLGSGLGFGFGFFKDIGALYISCLVIQRCTRKNPVQRISPRYSHLFMINSPPVRYKYLVPGINRNPPRRFTKPVSAKKSE